MAKALTSMRPIQGECTFVRFPSLSTIIELVVLASMVTLYYQLYWHYWFVELTSGWVIRAGLVVLPPMFVVLINYLMNGSLLDIRVNSASILNTFLVSYVVFSLLSIVGNEKTYNDVRIYVSYVAYPVILYFSVLAILKRVTQVRGAIRLLLITALLFSVYAVYFVATRNVWEIKPIETRVGEIEYFGGGFIGAGEALVTRLTIPGIASPTFGSLIMLAVLIGIYFCKTTVGISKWLYWSATIFLVACLLMTFSRGALISFIAGLMYLLVKGVFTARELIVGSVFMLIGMSIAYRIIVEQIEHLMIRAFGVGGEIGLSAVFEHTRVELVTHSWGMWKTCPVIGCGFTAFFETQLPLFAMTDHNYYTAMLATRGLVAFLPFGLFVGLLFYSISNRKTTSQRSERQEQQVKPMSDLLGAGMLALMVNLVMFAPGDFFHVWVWFALTTAWLKIGRTRMVSAENVIPSSAKRIVLRGPGQWT